MVSQRQAQDLSITRGREYNPGTRSSIHHQNMNGQESTTAVVNPARTGNEKWIKKISIRTSIGHERRGAPGRRTGPATMPKNLGLRDSPTQCRQDLRRRRRLALLKFKKRGAERVGLGRERENNGREGGRGRQREDGGAEEATPKRRRGMDLDLWNHAVAVECQLKRFGE